MRKLYALVACGMLLCGATEAKAGFLAGAVGNSFYDNGLGTTGWISYAVYVNQGGSGNWITDLGLTGRVFSGGYDSSSLPTVTGFENNVFFYELVRPAGGVAVASVTVPLNSPWAFGGQVATAPGTGPGDLPGMVFDEAGVGKVGDGTANVSLGTPAASVGSPTIGGPSLLDATPFIDSSTASTRLAESLLLNPNSTVTFARSWVPGSNSTILILATNDQGLVPEFRTGRVSIGGEQFDVLLPVSNPEPGSMLLMSVGMLGAGFVARRRKAAASQENKA